MLLQCECAMITGDKPSKCELADECRYDPNCSLWLACITVDQHEPAAEDVTVKNDLL